MSLDVEVDALRKVPIFRGIEPAKLRLLAFISERMSFDPGENVCEQGEAGDAAYVIMGGVADVVVNTPQGERPVAEVSQNDFVGEIAILCDVPRTATIRARSELNVLTISKENFLKLLQEFPDMGLEVMRVLAQRLEKTTRDLADVRAKLPAT